MLPRCLQSIGLKVFIDEYEFFESRPIRSEGINYLLKKKISRNEAGAARRLGAAKKLFSNPDLLHEALDYIANQSKEASKHQKEKASGILRRLSNRL